MLSHRSAAELWGFGYGERGRIDVTIPRRSRLERPGTKVRCRPNLQTGSVVRRFGIPVTHPVQTLIDVATELPGVKKLATLLDRHTFRLSDSDLEILFRPLALAARLPLPLTKNWILGFETDFFFPGLELIVETDGLRYHRTPAQQARAVKRDQTHVAAGYRVVRFTHWQVAHAAGEVTAVLRKLRG